MQRTDTAVRGKPFGLTCSKKRGPDRINREAAFLFALFLRCFRKRLAYLPAICLSWASIIFLTI